MGLTILNALSLTECWRAGARFDATVTLGRLECMMSAADLERIVRQLPPDSDFARAVSRGESPRYAEDFFRAMGARTVDAIDASGFEGASLIHDLNDPLPAAWRSRFDAVVDSGTIEHVFNAPMAFRNAMDALKVGGRFFAMLPANNYCGHGFYQFSAELFFRIFSEQNGFALQRLFVAPAWVAGRWLDGPVYEVMDPDDLGDRVEISGRRKMVFLVEAVKVEQRDVFARWPQQGGYADAWAKWTAAPVRAQETPQKLRIAMPLSRKLVIRAGSAGRILERFAERRRWKRQCADNPALKPHHWKE